MFQKLTQDNRKSKEQYSTYKAVIITIVIAITLIAIVNIGCILAMCYPDLFGIEVKEKLSGGDIVEATILSNGIAIIGLAVAVWTGLNIVNSIEKREIDKLQNRVYELNEEIKKRRSQQNRVDKDKFLHELYITAKDEATAVLIRMFKKLHMEANVPFLELLDIEQKFRNVYELHRSEFKQDDNLTSTAEEGILLAESLLGDNEESVVKLYLDLRIAEFHFYIGYCCLGQKRLEHFTTVIETYMKVANEFNADIPNYMEHEKYPSINYLQCEKIPAISAYFCNTIGEAYSKIEQEKKNLKKEKVPEERLELYGLKAVFYCAYANYWRTKSVYKRNLGCAIERTYSECLMDHYEELKDIYTSALLLDSKNINNFKNLVSLYDKYVNSILGIGPVTLPNSRKPALCSREFAYKIKNLTLDPDKQFPEVLAVLKNIHIVSKQAKAVHSSESIGYQYDCIYYRDMCMIYGNHMDETEPHEIEKMKVQAKAYLDQAEENWMILQVLAPYDSERPKENPMTRILRNDLDDLRRLL